MKDYCYYLNSFLKNVLITEETEYDCRALVIRHNRATVDIEMQRL